MDPSRRLLRCLAIAPTASPIASPSSTAGRSRRISSARVLLIARVAGRREARVCDTTGRRSLSTTGSAWRVPPLTSRPTMQVDDDQAPGAAASLHTSASQAQEQAASGTSVHAGAAVAISIEGTSSSQEKEAPRPGRWTRKGRPAPRSLQEHAKRKGHVSNIGAVSQVAGAPC